MQNLDLLRATAVLFSIAFAVGLLQDWLGKRWPKLNPAFTGIKFGMIALVGMTTPLVVGAGIQYDVRVPLVGLAGLFGGWIGALIATIPPFIYRLYIGGVGMEAGLASLVTGALLGLVAHRRFLPRRLCPNWIELTGMGAIFAISAFLWTLLLPEPIRHAIIVVNGLTIGAAYILATTIFGMLEVQRLRRQENERALIENQRLLDGAQRIGQFGFWIYDFDTKEGFLSTHLQEMVAGKQIESRLSIDEIIERYLHPDDRSAAAKAFAEAASRRAPEPLQFRVIHESRTQRVLWAHFVGQDIDENGHRVAIFLVQDITDKSRLFEQMSHAARLATLGETAASIGHEIVNPLFAARLMAERVERKFTNQQFDDPSNLDMIKRIVNRLDATISLVRSISHFARTESEPKKFVSIHEIIYQAVEFFGEVTTANAPRVELDLLAEEDHVLGSPMRFQQIFLNLFNNARHAMKETKDPKLSISTRNSGGELLVSISDNGPGIPEELKTKIFAPFFTTKEPGNGTGLGLSITESLVSDAGGKIQVRSEPGFGATFEIRVPVAPMAAATGGTHEGVTRSAPVGTVWGP